MEGQREGRRIPAWQSGRAVECGVRCALAPLIVSGRAPRLSRTLRGMWVNRRKCGTCRFYQEASLASSGWCHHPQRKVTSDLLIMVRKNELACRDEWSHDLWESIADQSGATAPRPFTGHAVDRR